MIRTRDASALCLALTMALPGALGAGPDTNEGATGGAPEDGVQARLAADLHEGDAMSYAYKNRLVQQQFMRTMLAREHFLDYELAFDLTVTSVSELYTDLEFVLTGLEVDSTWGTFDSDQPVEDDARNLAAMAFRPVLGEPFSVRLRSNMEVLGITGPPTTHVPQPVHALYMRMLGERMLSEAIQPIFRLKPEPHRAAPGDQWSQTLQRNTSAGEIEIRLDLELDELDADAAHVRIDGEHRIMGMHNTPVSQRITEQAVAGEAAWDVDASSLASFALRKDFVVSAGGEEFAIRFDVSEEESLERRD